MNKEEVCSYKREMTKNVHDEGLEGIQMIEGAVALIEEMRKAVSLGEPQAAELVIRALGHDYLRVREVAAEELLKIGPPAVDVLLYALKDRDSDVRWLAAQVLGHLGDPRAVEQLKAALRDEDLYVRKAAAGALRLLGWEPTEEAEAAWFFMASGYIRDCVEFVEAAKEALVFALRDREWFIRADAVIALGEIGRPWVLYILVSALRDEHDEVRKVASVALRRLGYHGC